MLDAARAVMFPSGFDLTPRLIDVLPVIRVQAWNHCCCGGVQFAKSPALAAYAGWRELGAPMTDVEETCGFIWQGYAFGIVVAPKDDLAKAEVHSWYAG